MKKELKKLAVNKKMLSLILTTTITLTSCGIGISQNESSKTSSNEIGYVNTSSITSSKDTSSANTSTEITSSMEVSSDTTSSKEVSSKEVSSEISSKETSSKDVSSKETSSKEVSSKETSSKETSSKDTSSQETSSIQTSMSDSDYLASLPAYWQQKFADYEKHYAYVEPYADIVQQRQRAASATWSNCHNMAIEILDLNNSVSSPELSQKLDEIKKIYFELEEIMNRTTSCIRRSDCVNSEYYINKVISERFPVEKLSEDFLLEQIFGQFEYGYQNLEQCLIWTESSNLNRLLNETTQLYNEALNIYNSLGKQKTLVMN